MYQYSPSGNLDYVHSVYSDLEAVEISSLHPFVALRAFAALAFFTYITYLSPECD